MLKKELIEVEYNKKFLLLGGIGLIFPLLANLVSSNPLLPLDHVFLILSIVAASSGGELVYSTMISELQNGAFDILLVCPVDKYKIVLYKLIIPIIFTSIITILGLGFNDVVASFVLNKFLYSNAFCTKNILATLCSSATCCIVEYIGLIVYDKKTIKLHTILIAAEVCLLSVLFILGNCISAWLPIAICCLTFLFLLQFASSLISNLSPMRTLSKIFQRFDLIPDVGSSYVAIIFEELYAIPSCTYFLIRWLTLLILLVHSINFQMPIFYLISFLCSSFGSTEILFPSFVIEKEMNTIDVIRTALPNKISLNLKRCIFPIAISEFGAFASIAIENIIYGVSAISSFLTFELFVCISLLLCILIANKFVSNKAESRIGKALLLIALLISFVVIKMPIFTMISCK